MPVDLGPLKPVGEGYDGPVDTMPKDWMENVFTWLESDHWTSCSFRFVVKGLACVYGLVACVMLLWITGKDYFKEIRQITMKDSPYC